MARGQAQAPREVAGPAAPHDATPYEQAHVIRRMDPASEARMHELAERHNEGQLTAEELAEYDRLIQQAEELTLGNARALLRHRNPAAYAAALAEEQRILRRAAVPRRPRRQAS